MLRQIKKMVTGTFFLVDLPYQLPLQDFQQIGLDAPYLAQVSPFSSEVNKNVLDAILQNMLVFGNLGAVSKHGRSICPVDMVESCFIPPIKRPPDIQIRLVFVLFNGFGIL